MLKAVSIALGVAVPTVARAVRMSRAMAALWFEERSGTPVWHLVVSRDSGSYQMACGWQFRLVDVRRVWPQKDDERGPDERERCSICMT